LPYSLQGVAVIATCSCHVFAGLAVPVFAVFAVMAARALP